MELLLKQCHSALAKYPKNKFLLVVSITGVAQGGKSSILHSLLDLKNPKAIGNGFGDCTSTVTLYGPKDLNELLVQFHLSPIENSPLVLFFDTPGLAGNTDGFGDINTMNMVNKFGAILNLSHLILFVQEKELYPLLANVFSSFIATVNQARHGSFQQFQIFRILNSIPSMYSFQEILQTIQEQERKANSPILQVPFEKYLPFPEFDSVGYIWQQSSNFKAKADESFREILKFLVQKSKYTTYTVESFQNLLKFAQQKINDLNLISLITQEQEIMASTFHQKIVLTKKDEIVKNQIQALELKYINGIRDNLLTYEYPCAPPVSIVGF